MKIGDAFSGKMQWVEIANDPSKSYFECERYFKPSGEKIGVSVTGPLSGPTQRQKDFFTQLEINYPRLVAKFTPVVEAEFGAWISLPIIESFTSKFKPVGLHIPDCDELPIEWEIVFDTVHDVNHTVTVGMRNDGPQYVRVDG